ncbi:MAG TPA: hypothetical protein VGX28_07240 [Frankiaceae bacterium]|jgi:hypothetical protein|nr:hypothetical protein [Frankiaceae bacterium]
MRRLRVATAAVAATFLLGACGEPRTTAEYERLVRSHLAIGAAAGLVLYGVLLGLFAWRHRGRRWYALGPASPVSGLATFGSVSALALLSGLAGATVASLAVPDDPARVDALFPHTAGPAHAIAVLAVALVALPFLAVIGALFADFAEYPPRGVGAVPAALMHATVALVALRLGVEDPSREEQTFRLLLAAPCLAAALAYVVMHARWWMSRRREC